MDNINHNPSAERVAGEFQQEELKHSKGQLSEFECALITKSINLKLQNREWSSYEMLLKRKPETGDALNIDDKILEEKQKEIHKKSHNKVKPPPSNSLLVIW